MSRGSQRKVKQVNKLDLQNQESTVELEGDQSKKARSINHSSLSKIEVLYTNIDTLTILKKNHYSKCISYENSQISYALRK